MSEIDDATRELKMIYSRLKRVSMSPNILRSGIHEDIRQSMEDLEHINSNLLGILNAVYIIRRKLDFIAVQTRKFPNMRIRDQMQAAIYEIDDELKKISRR